MKRTHVISSGHGPVKIPISLWRSSSRRFLEDGPSIRVFSGMEVTIWPRSDLPHTALHVFEGDLFAVTFPEAPRASGG